MTIEHPLLRALFDAHPATTQARLDEAVDRIAVAKGRGGKVVVVTGSGPNLHEGVTTLIAELMRLGLVDGVTTSSAVVAHEMGGTLDLATNHGLSFEAVAGLGTDERTMIGIGARRGLPVLVTIPQLVGGGWRFSRRVKSTEGYFLGNRSYPGWVAGVSLFGAQISSITFVAYPADAFKTAWLRYLICLTLPVSVFVATRYLLPFFRRGNVTSLFEYLEARFGPKTRVYGASVFLLSQCIRISIIQYLVALLMHSLTGWSVPACLLLGGVVTAYYTIVGGLEAVIWTDVAQALILTAGGVLILATIVWELPGGIGQLLATAHADGKLLFGEPGADGRIHAITWGFSLTRKTVVMLLFVGVLQWLTDYVTNQEVVQRYCAAKSAKDARRAMWICCWSCLPTWGYFMLVGTGLYVFYKVHPDPAAAEMYSGAHKAEEIVPFFVTTQLGPGFSGLVVAAVFAAAMSGMSSAMNSMASVAITDLYRRHLVPGRPPSRSLQSHRHPDGSVDTRQFIGAFPFEVVAGDGTDPDLKARGFRR